MAALKLPFFAVDPAEVEAGACVGDDLSKTQKDVIISNWPGYIDPRKKPTSTVSVFQDRTGVTVDYTDDVNDNDEFYAQGEEPARVVRADQPRHDDADRLDGGQDDRPRVDPEAGQGERAEPPRQPDRAAAQPSSGTPTSSSTRRGRAA